MPDLNLADIAGRPRRYWDVDGLPELMMGLLWMIWGGAWLFGQTLPRDDWRFNAYWMFTPVILAFGSYAAIWATKRLKRRLTFPRTGYVEWREPSRSARLAAAAAAIVAASALVLIGAKAGPGTDRLAAPALGVILSLGFVVASLTQRAPQYLALAAVAIALGLVFGARNLGWTGANWMFVILGAASVAIGGVRLALFVRKHPLGGTEEP